MMRFVRSLSPPQYWSSLDLGRWKTSTAIAFITLFSASLGFVRDFLLARRYGSGWTSDAFFLALTIPMVLENVLGVSVREAIIPYLQKHRGMTRTADIEVRRLFGKLAIMSLLVSLPFCLWPEFWLEMLSPGTSLSDNPLCRTMFVLGSLSIVATTCAYFQTGLLQSSGRFMPGALRSTWFNVATITAILLFPDQPQIAIVGMLVGQVLHAIWQQFILRELNVDRSVTEPDLASQAQQGRFFTVELGLSPIILIALFAQLNVLMERWLASWNGVGSVAAISYAWRIASIPLVLLTVSFAAVQYPKFSEYFCRSKFDELRVLLRRSQVFCLIFMGSAAAYLCYYAEALAEELFRNDGSSNAKLALAQAIRLYALGMPAQGLLLIGGRFLLATGETGKLLVASVLGSLCFAVIAGIAAPFWAASGIAGSVSAAALLQVIWLRRAIVGRNERNVFWMSLARGHAAPVAVYLILNSFPSDNLLFSLLSIPMCLLLTAAMTGILGDRDVLDCVRKRTSDAV